MKKTFKALLSMFLAVFMVVSLVSIPSSAAGITKSSITLTKGYQTTLKFSGSSNVTWSTGDKSIATVTSSGKVSGKSAGTTYIYAKSGGTTYKCKVNVVPSKITASKSTVDIDQKGGTATVTLTVKGSHNNLTLASTDRSVATASWVRPWDGDKIKIKITGKGNGSCRIKIYNKNYSSTCYKYIDVNVGDSLFEDDGPDTGDLVISASAKTLNVDAGKSATISVYCSNINQLGADIYNKSIASINAGTVSGNYRTFSVSGLAVGSTVVRFYDKNNVKNYVDVTVNVGGDLQYYEFYETRPASLIRANDIVKQISANNKTYYVIVPANYDPANLNTIMAEDTKGRFGGYQYYTVYDKLPSKRVSGDTYKEFTNYNYNSYYYYDTRYILLPAKYDEVKYNTAMAVYNNKFDYYTVYSEKPNKNDSWDDIEEWTVKDETGKNVKRYVLYRWADADWQTKVDALKKNDQTNNNAYNYYVLYDKQPVYNTSTEECRTYYVPYARYMIIPKTDANIVKINDTIKKVTNTYEKYTWYSSKPTSLAANESTITRYYGTNNDKAAYMVVNDKDSDYQLRYNNAWSQTLTDKT